MSGCWLSGLPSAPGVSGRADVVTVPDDGLILAIRAAALAAGHGRLGPGEAGWCRIVARGADGGLVVVSRTWLGSWPGCRAGGYHAAPAYPVWLTTNPW